MTPAEFKRAVDLIRAATDQEQAVTVLKGILDRRSSAPLKLICPGCEEPLSVCPRCFLKKKITTLGKTTVDKAKKAAMKKAPQWLQLANDILFTPDEEEV